MYLKELGIKNYIVFDDVNITFEKPFSCFTGETGAGKSAIFSSLLLLQGEKVSDTCFLNKERDIEICATLEILKDDVLIYDFLSKNEIEIEDNLYFTRRIKPTGKSVFKVCGEVINKNQAEELFLLIFSFCNQKSSNDIFDSSYILSGIDNYGNLKELSEEVKEKRCKLNLLKKEIEKLKTEIENQKGDEDYYNYAISEIERVDLKLNEDEEIKDKIKLLKNAEQTFNISE